MKNFRLQNLLRKTLNPTENPTIPIQPHPHESQNNTCHKTPPLSSEGECVRISSFKE